MASIPIRETRETEHIPGIGGFLEFQWPDFTDPSDPELVEVRQWEIQRRIITVSLPESGNHGALSKYRVADDFIFFAVLDLDATPVRTEGIPRIPGFKGQPFIDGRLEGDANEQFKISMRFQLGDPTFITQPNSNTLARTRTAARGIFYYCDSVILEEVRTITSAKGDAVVSYVVKGSGSAPLRRYIDTQWAGAGAFGLARAVQGHKEKGVFGGRP